MFLFYLLYFGIIGGFQPYYPEYLKHLSFTEVQIGTLVAVSNLIKLGPLFFTRNKDNKQFRRISLIRSCAIISGMFYIGFYFFADTFMGQCLVMISYGSIWATIMPVLFSSTQVKLTNNEHFFGVIRASGTFGYLVSVFITGYYMSFHASNLIHVMGVATFLLAVASFLIDEKPVKSTRKAVQKQEIETTSMVQVKPGVFLPSLICVAFLTGLVHGPLFTLGSLYFNEMGYTGLYKSALWGISMVAEITFLFVSAWMLLTNRVTIRIILMVSLFAAIVRWYLMAYLGDSYFAMCIGQVLHAFTFSGTELSFVAMAKFVVDSYGANNNHQLTRLNIFIFSAGQGIGSPLGCWLAGVSWKYFGYQHTFVYTGLITTFVWAIAFFGLQYSTKQSEKAHPSATLPA